MCQGKLNKGPLPYSFDLLYDFKTVEQLHNHLTGRLRYATSATDFELIALAEDLNVALPEGISNEPPLAIAIKALGGRVPQTATHYSIAGAVRCRNGVTELRLQFFRRVDGEWQQFLTDSDDEYPQWAPATLYYRDGAFAKFVEPKLRVLEDNK